MQRQTVTFATIKSVAKKIAKIDGISEEEATQKLIHAYGHENIDFSKKQYEVVNPDLNFVAVKTQPLPVAKTDLEKTQPLPKIRQVWPLQA